MKQKLLISILFLSLQWMIFPVRATAEQNEEAKNYIKMHFSGKVGSQYALLIMGAKTGEYTLDWGNGETATSTLNTSATTITGELKSQDLTIYGNISVLECSGNGLTTLDVTKMPTLTHLISRDNYVEEMDFSKCKELKVVCIQSSPLKSLDLSENTKIDSVIVSNNRIASLKLPQESELEYLLCTTNSPLTELDLSGLGFACFFNSPHRFAFSEELGVRSEKLRYRLRR